MPYTVKAEELWDSQNPVIVQRKDQKLFTQDTKTKKARWVLPAQADGFQQLRKDLNRDTRLGRNSYTGRGDSVDDGEIGKTIKSDTKRQSLYGSWNQFTMFALGKEFIAAVLKKEHVTVGEQDIAINIDEVTDEATIDVVLSSMQAKSLEDATKVTSIPGSIKVKFNITEQGVEVGEVITSNHLLYKCLFSEEVNITPADLRYAQVEEMFNGAVKNLQLKLGDDKLKLNATQKEIIEQVISDVKEAAQNYFGSNKTEKETNDFIKTVSDATETAQVVPVLMEEVVKVQSAAENTSFVPAAVAVDKAINKMETFGESLKATNLKDAETAKNAANEIRDKNNAFFIKPNKTLAEAKAFERDVQAELDKASESLNKHAKWKDVLVAMTVIGGFAMLINKAVTGRYSFFATAPERTIDKTKKEVIETIKRQLPTPLTFGPGGGRH